MRGKSGHAQWAAYQRATSCNTKHACKVNGVQHRVGVRAMRGSRYGRHMQVHAIENEEHGLCA